MYQGNQYLFQVNKKYLKSSAWTTKNPVKGICECHFLRKIAARHWFILWLLNSSTQKQPRFHAFPHPQFLIKLWERNWLLNFFVIIGIKDWTHFRTLLKGIHVFVAGHFVVDKLISDPKCSAIIAELFDVAFFCHPLSEKLDFRGINKFSNWWVENQEGEKIAYYPVQSFRIALGSLISG